MRAKQVGTPYERGYQALTCGLRKIGMGVCCMLLAGCFSGNTYVPVVDLMEPSHARQGYHVVQRGETLYSIAWSYGWDYRQLARANGIKPPYNIYPGQRLSLSPARADTPRPVTPDAGTTEQRVTVKVPVAGSTRGSQATQAPAEEKTMTGQPQTVATKLEKYQLPSIVTWHWPVKGKVLSGFSATGRVNKGIDIAADMGQSVKAAGQGIVVYAGRGPRGYGQLVIIKHNKQFLSAYAHNRNLLVAESDIVQAGQRIATIGRSDTNQGKLHFEIRREGKPVDPLRYLPRQ